MGGHYYDHQGNARHDATKKQVRDENLLISVTTYLGLINAPGLNKWKETQLLNAAHSLLKENSLSFEDLKKSAYNQFEAENRAHIIGTSVHDILEKLIKENPHISAEKEFFFAYADNDAKPLYQATMMAFHWLQTITTQLGNAEETIINVNEHYAGQLDYFGDIKDPLNMPAPGIIDWKTQGLKHPGFFKKDPSKLKQPSISKYDSWGMQMGAYARVKKAQHGYIGLISSNADFPFFKPIHYTGGELIHGYQNFIKIKDVYRYLNKL